MKKNIIVLAAFFLFLLLFVQKNIIQINNNWAVVDFENGKIMPAIKKFKNAIRYKGQKNIIKYNLANANFKINNHEEAKKIYMELLQNTEIPNSLKSEIYFNIGNIAFMYENYEEALENYYMALLLNSADSDIKFNIEMIEYMNRPIIYNNEILLLPRKKIDEQLAAVKNIEDFEYKVNEYISEKYNEYRNEYAKIFKDVLFKNKYLLEISKTEYKKLQDSRAFFDANNPVSGKYMSGATGVFKETDRKISYIRQEFSNLKKNKDMFENCKDIIVKEAFNVEKQNEQKQKLQDILGSFADKYQDNSEQFAALYSSIFKNRQKNQEDTEENSLCLRSSIYKINQLEYNSFIDSSGKILLSINDLINLINNSLPDMNAGEQKDLKLKFIELSSVAGDMYIKEQFSNYDNINKVYKQILTLENEFSDFLGEGEKAESFIEKFDLKSSQNTDYILWQKKILWYKERIDSLYMIYAALIDQSIDNLNNAESFKTLVKSKISEKFAEKKDILNSIKNIFPDASQHIMTLKQQKQTCKEIQINSKNKIGIIFKIFMNRFYFYNFQFNKKSLDENKNYFNNQLISFKEKEEYAKIKKNEMSVVTKEMQELYERMVYLKENKHMYVNFKESNDALEKEKTVKQIKLKQIELVLLGNIKDFMKNFIENADAKSDLMKKNVSKIKLVLQEIVKINEFEQENIKENFLREKMELESEMLKFEKEKEYMNNTFFGQNNSQNLKGQTLMAKSLYQKEQLDSLLFREREITKQIKELQYLTGQLSETEQHELDMLEKDLVEKQLSLVKYYLTVENDNTKKNLTRSMMQSLYKTQYNVEEKTNINNFADFEGSKGIDVTRNAILQIYKSSIDQLREFNKLIYRMKIINAILELEYITQLSKQIEMNADNKNISALKQELQFAITKEMQYKVLELEKISDISKENITFAKYLKESIETAKEKQKKEKEKMYKEEKANLERKIHIVNEKINMLEDFIKNKDSDVSVDIKKIKSELKEIRKEQKALAAGSKEIDNKILVLKKESTHENNVSSVIQSADLISSNINISKDKKNKENLQDSDSENSAENKSSLRTTDVNRILSSYSNSEKVTSKKVNIKEQVKNDW